MSAGERVTLPAGLSGGLIVRNGDVVIVRCPAGYDPGQTFKLGRDLNDEHEQMLARGVDVRFLVLPHGVEVEHLADDDLLAANLQRIPHRRPT